MGVNNDSTVFVYFMYLCTVLVVLFIKVCYAFSNLTCPFESRYIALNFRFM